MEKIASAKHQIFEENKGSNLEFGMFKHSSSQNMQLLVNGGEPLHGSVTLSGSKHSALAILGVIPIAKGKIELENFPDIYDTYHMVKVIESLGAKVVHTNTNIKLQVRDISYNENEFWRINKLRSTILFLGSILVRSGYLCLPTPGGDKLGIRSINEFLYVLEKYGIHHNVHDDHIEAKLHSTLKGDRDINLCSNIFPEMGNNRTVLGLIFAWVNRGKTTLRNSLILPEIVEVCDFLEKISNGNIAIHGIGTDTLVINSPGADIIHQGNVDVDHTLNPDKCENAFWIAAASLTHGDIIIRNIYESSYIRTSMKLLRNNFLRSANIQMDILGENCYRVFCRKKRAYSFDLESTAHELSGIAFDASPLFASILLNSMGKGSFYCFKYKHERVKWVIGLEQIGAQYEIKTDGTLIIEGVHQLYAANPVYLNGEDIRGASCVLLASLATLGEPIIFQGLEHVQRGMEKPIIKLQNLGAKIVLLDN